MGMGTGVGCGLVGVLGIGANWRLGSRWNEYLFVGGFYVRRIHLHGCDKSVL